MNVLWSKPGEETEFVLAFPESEQELAFTATVPAGRLPFFRHIAFRASGNHPILFVHRGAQPLQLRAHRASANGALPQTDELDVSFASSAAPTHAQLFGAHVSAHGIAFEIGPRIDWPANVSNDEPRAADALRGTDAFEDFRRNFDTRRDGGETAVFISATPLRIEPPASSATPVAIAAPPQMTVMPTLDLWPHLVLRAKIKVTRESDRRPGDSRTAIEFEFARKTQPFRDTIEIAVNGDRGVAESLSFRQVRRQAVASSLELARVEPEIKTLLPHAFDPILEHPLDWKEKDGRHVASIKDIPVARGDCFLLVSPDAELVVEWIEEPDGTQLKAVVSVAAADGIEQARLVAWRHDGQKLKTFSNRTEFNNLRSSHFYGGLIDEALRPWTERGGQDPSISSLWRTLLRAAEIPRGTAVADSADFVKQIVGDEGAPRRLLIARHSPFVALAALRRWLALGSGAWKVRLGHDNRSIERLLSPIAGWLAHRADVATPTSPVPIADDTSDVADHFLRWVQQSPGIRLNTARTVAPENIAGLALLLLRDVERNDSELANQAEDIRVTVAPPDAIDPRAHELIQTFRRILVGSPIKRKDADLGFYRAATLAFSAPTTGGERNLLFRFEGHARPDAYCSLQDLNGAPLGGFDVLADFASIFERLTQALAEVKAEVNADEDLQALRARIASATTSPYDEPALRQIADRIAAEFKAKNRPWDSKQFMTLVHDLAQPDSGSPRDHARQALVGDRLAQLTKASAALQKLKDGNDQIRTMEDHVVDPILTRIVEAIGPGMVLDPAFDRNTLSPQQRDAFRPLDSALFHGAVTGTGLRDKDESLEARYQALRTDFEVSPRPGPGPKKDAWDAAFAALERLSNEIGRNKRSSRFDDGRADDLPAELETLRGILAHSEAAMDEFQRWP